MDAGRAEVRRKPEYAVLAWVRNCVQALGRLLRAVYDSSRYKYRGQDCCLIEPEDAHLLKDIIS